MHETCRGQPIDKQCGDCLLETARGLQAIVAKLPTNGDGEPIVPGDRGFCNGVHRVVEVEIESIYTGSDTVLVGQLPEDGDECWEVVDSDLFSTRKSAEEAKR